MRIPSPTGRSRQPLAGACTVLLLAAAFGAMAQNDSELLDLSLEELMNVRVVSASKTPQQRWAAPASINLLEGDELRARGVQTIAEALETLPELSILRGSDSKRTLVARGIASDDGVLVLMNGLPVNDAFSGSYHFFERPINDIERLEVIRGPGSALYGGNALVAVVNVITRRPKAGTELRLDAGAASHDQRRYGVHFASDLDENVGSLRFSTGFTLREGRGETLDLVQDRLYTPVRGPFLPPLTNPSLTPTRRAENLRTETGYFNLSLGEFQADYHYERLRSTPLYSYRNVVVEEGDLLHVDALNALDLRYRLPLGETLVLTPRIYAVLNQSKKLGDSEPPQFLPDENQDGLNEGFPSGIIESLSDDILTRGAELAGDYRFNAQHGLSVGLVHERTRLEEAEKLANITRIGRAPIALHPLRDMSREFMDAGLERRLSAAYLEYRYEPTAELSATLGLRHGRYDDFGDTTTPRVGLAYRFAKSWYAKLLYAEAFKPPSFVELYDRTPTLSPFRTQGNPDLEPTTIKTGELQLGYQPDERLEILLTLSDSRTANEIFFDSTAGVRRWTNSGERHAQGAALELRAHLGDAWTVSGNYAYQDTEGVTTGIAAPIRPPHRLNLAADYHFAGRWRLRADAQHFSRPDREAGDPRPRVAAKTYVHLSLNAEELWQGVSLRLSLRNALDEEGADETVRSDGIVEDMPRTGRDLWLNLEKRF